MESTPSSPSVRARGSGGMPSVRLQFWHIPKHCHASRLLRDVGQVVVASLAAPNLPCTASLRGKSPLQLRDGLGWRPARSLV